MVRFTKERAREVSWWKNVERLNEIQEWVLVDLYYELNDKIDALEARIKALEEA